MCHAMFIDMLQKIWKEEEKHEPYVLLGHFPVFCQNVTREEEKKNGLQAQNLLCSVPEADHSKV